MGNIFSNKSFMNRYFSAPKSTGPAKLTDLSGDGKVTQKDVLIGKGVLDAPKQPAKMQEQEGPAKRTRAEKRLEKTKEKAQDAKDATRGKKSSESEEVKRQANKAKRLDKKVKRQEGRAERKKIRKIGYTDAFVTRNEIKASRKNQKSKKKDSDVKSEEKNNKTVVKELKNYDAGL